MKCTIPGVSLKVFGRAIQSLSKIGDELYFEPQEDGLYLRTVNSCRSAYGCFQFSPAFFVHYVDGWSGGDDKSGHTEDSEEDAVRCKLGMKSVMTVFRNLSSLDKTVEQCCISLDMKEACLTFKMVCRHGIIKTHNLSFIECETLEAVSYRDKCSNMLTTPPKLLCDAVVNFQTTQEEITLTVRPDFVALKNYVEDEPDPKKVIHTELTLAPDEFDNYQVGLDAAITFCLKELRAILAFADVTGLPLSLHFESAGKPVTMSITSDLSFEANFVLATLSEVDSSQPPPSPHTHKQNTAKKTDGGKTHRPQAQTNGANKKTQQTSSKHQQLTTGDSEDDDEDLVQASTTNCTISDETITSDSTVHQSRLGPTQTFKNPQTRRRFSEEEQPNPQRLGSQSNNFSRPGSQTHNFSKPGSQNNNFSKPGSQNNNFSKPGSQNNNFSRPGNHNNFSRSGCQNNISSQSLRKDQEDGSMEVARCNMESENQRQTPSSLMVSTISKANNSSLPNDRMEDVEDDFDDLQSFLDKSEMNATLRGSPKQSESVPGKQLLLKSQSSTEQSPVIPVMDQTVTPGRSPIAEVSEEEEDDEEDTIPGTPPYKKFRSVFFGTQSSTQPSQSQSKAVILAPNSDDED